MKNPVRAKIILRACELSEHAEEFYYEAKEQLRNAYKSNPLRTANTL